MPFVFLLFWSLLHVLVCKIKYCNRFNPTSQIFNWHFNKVDGKERQKIHQLSNECVLFFASFTVYRLLLMLLFPLFIPDCMMC